jgi:hypothetical protein
VKFIVPELYIAPPVATAVLLVNLTVELVKSSVPPELYIAPPPWFEAVPKAEFPVNPTFEFEKFTVP